MRGRPYDEAMTAWLSIAAVALAVLLLLRALIWRGFRAPRLPEATTPPGGVQVVRVPTVRGRTLHGWWRPPAAPGAGALCLIHGWGANASVMLPLTEAYRAHDPRGVLVLTARGHGGSDDDTFASLPRFAEDLEAGLDWLTTRPEVCPTDIVLAGHSVGAGAALLVGSRRHDLAAVVALSPFAHPHLVMRAYLDRARIPWCPIGWLVSRYVERIIGHRFDAIAPMATAARQTAPATILHGTADAMVPFAQARLIRRRAPTVRLVTLPGVDHLGTGATEDIAAAMAAAISERARPATRVEAGP